MKHIIFKAFIGIGCLTIFSFSQVYLKGNICGDLHKQTYLIKEKIVVPPHSRLTIHAGTELRFEDSASIDIYGNLAIAGTSTEPVTLSSMGDSTWDGIRVYNGCSGIELAGVIISQCQTGIYLASSVDTLRLHLSKVMFRECQLGISDALQRELLPAHSKGVSGFCDYPSGECNLLKNYYTESFSELNPPGQEKAKRNRIILRKPTVKEKIIVSGMSVALVAISVFMFWEHKTW